MSQLVEYPIHSALVKFQIWFCLYVLEIDFSVSLFDGIQQYLKQGKIIIESKMVFIFIIIINIKKEGEFFFVESKRVSIQKIKKTHWGPRCYYIPRAK